MVTNGDKWVRIFDIPDTSKHKKGFTVYKVISMLYPESRPDAVTKVTVWKRYNDFRKLHQEMKALHKTLGLKDKLPGLLRATLFRRFDEETIQQRRQCALQFLEYIGSHFDLFTSKEVIKFFETSHVPGDHLNSNISTIRAELNLPEEPEYVTFMSSNSDDERTFSDTDSVSTLSSFGASTQITDILSEHSLQNCTLPKLLAKRLENSHSSKISMDSQESLNIAISSDSGVNLEGQIYPTPPNTPGSSVDENPNYIHNAKHHINVAQECERNKDYENAFAEYKAGVEILQEHIKGDKNEDRKMTVRYDIQKYSVRAEKIYNMYLSPEVRNFQEIMTVERKVPSLQQIVSNHDQFKGEKNEDGEATASYSNNKFVIGGRKISNCSLAEASGAQEIVTVEKEVLAPQKTIAELYKYKVIKVICSGMLVLHSELHQPYFVKVLRKTANFLNKNMVLPENVPFMVKLHGYHNCENALFLILQYCSGVKLSDYIKQLCSSLTCEPKSTNDTFLDTQHYDNLQSDSDDSYSDLINDYTSSKLKAALQYKKDDSINTSKTSDINDLENRQEETDNPNEPSFSGTETHNYSTDKINTFLRKNSSKSLTDDFSSIECVVVPQTYAVKWGAQLLLALEKLHQLGVTCVDLHFENLLVDDGDNLVLTYMCNINDLTDAFINKNVSYLAPEIYSFQPLTTTVDWWCYGLIMYKLLVGMSLKTIHPEGLSNYTSLKVPKYVSAEGRSLLNQLLVCDPQERLGCGINGTEDIKSHPFFSTVSWDSLLS